VIATHDGEIGLREGDFAEAHVAAASGVEFGLDVSIGEKDKIERARLRPIVEGEWRQDRCGASGGESLEDIPAIELHSRLFS